MSNILGLSGGTGKFILYILAVSMFLEIRKKVNGILKHIRTSLQVNFHTPLELKIAVFLASKKSEKVEKAQRDCSYFFITRSKVGCQFGE